MDRHELNQMFDGLEPDPWREQELLRQLLQDDARRKIPMKNWKRAVVGVAAAALLVTAATAAVAPGISQKLLAYLGVAPENTQATELLMPGAMAVDITKEDNGATLHVTQVLRDRTSIMVLADFTAPEGTVLDADELNPGCFRGFGADMFVPFPDFLNEAKEKIGDDTMVSWFKWEVLDDGNPLDNHLSLMLMLTPRENEPVLQKAAFLRIPADNLSRFDIKEQGPVTIYSGDWSFEVPLPQKDIGYTMNSAQSIGELDGVSITLEGLYVSPMTLQFTIARETAVDWDKWLSENSEDSRQWASLLLDPSSRITLKTKDGTAVSLLGGNGYTLSGPSEKIVTLRLAEITDPAEFRGGTLTLDLSCGTVAIPLNDLVPVEP